MQRVFTKDIKVGDRTVYAKGEIRDYPLMVWKWIARTVRPKDHDLMHAVNDFTQPLEDLGAMLGAKR